MEPSDAQLMGQIKAGDREAMEILARRWYPKVFGYALRLTGREQDAYDVTQDTFLALMEHLESYRPWKGFQGWLFTIAHNKCVDLFRWRKPAADVDGEGLDLPDPAPLLEETVGESLAVDAALGRLPGPQREAAVLHHGYGFTAREIARMTDTPLPTVKSRLAAAKRTLTRELKEEFQ